MLTCQYKYEIFFEKSKKDFINLNLSKISFIFHIYYIINLTKSQANIEKH